jgi:mono-ADP-ribosyltransferase sirtuin 6
MQDLLNSIRGFNKRNLGPVETNVNTQAVVEEQQKEKEREERNRGGYRWHFGHEREEDKIEWFDEADNFRTKCKKLAQMIKKARYVVVYTGAGISTSAKLPDYRGSDGMWTNRDRGTQLAGKYTTISQALPTLAHMAIAELVNRGMVKFVVSTNVDGLHMRTGLKRLENLAELHGNSYLETCNKCGTSYLRPQDVLQNQTDEHRVINRHWCGGRCEKEGCDGLLLDSIVAFGETLPEDQLEAAIEESKKGDLAIVLGSTMMVHPACELPGYIYKKNRGKMVICNLQNTPYDRKAEFLIHGHLDDVWYLVMKELGIEIPTRIPEGAEIPPYVEDIDAKHAQKRKECEAKMKELQENPQQTDNALTRGDNPYQRNVISGRNEDRDVTFKTLELAFFHECYDSTYRLQSKTKKVVLENCHNTTITINDKIITSYVEIINSTNIKLILNTSAQTLTCDNAEGVDIQFANPEYFQMIAWAKVRGASVSLGEDKLDLEALDRANYDTDQIITKREDTGEIASRVTQRDRCGRITHLVSK